MKGKFSGKNKHAGRVSSTMTKPKPQSDAISQQSEKLHAKKKLLSSNTSVAEPLSTIKKSKPQNSAIPQQSGKPSGKKPLVSPSSRNKKKRNLEGKPSQTTTSQSQIKKQKVGLSARSVPQEKMILVESLKDDWNKIRIKSITAEERESISRRLMDKIRGRVLQVGLRHDVSRVVQALFQFGSEAQRSLLLDELISKLLETCKTQYGHFTVLKAITYCIKPQDQKKICGAMAGHFVSLGTNTVGARTVESVLQLYSPKLTRSLRAEFYGKNFKILLSEPPQSLRKLLEALPSKESAILDHMRDLCQRFIEKGLLEFTYVHNLLWEYVRELMIDKEEASEQHHVAVRREELVTQLAEAAPKLMSTKPGSKLTCVLATWAGAKERKRMIKVLKGKVLESLLHHAGHLVIMRLVDVVDDTVNIQKSLLQEIRVLRPETQFTASGDAITDAQSALPPLAALAVSQHGCKLLLRLLAPQSSHLEPDEETLFSTQVTTSKKTFSARRKEHLVFLRSPLVSVCSRYADLLMRSRFGVRVLHELVAVFYPAQLLRSLAQAAAGVELDRYSDCDGADAGADGVDEGDHDEEYDADDMAYDGEQVGDGDFEEEVQQVEEEEAEEQGGDDGQEEEDFGDVDDYEDEGATTSIPSAPPTTPLLPIQEDPIAHALMKKVAAVEAASDDTDTDRSLWESEAKSRRGTFSTELLRLLEESDGLRAWASCNRACFALSSLCAVSAARPALLRILPALLKLTQGADATAGAKALREALNAL